jgi:hypothetical protein
MKRDHKRNANCKRSFVPVLPFTNPIILTILVVVVVVLSVTISSVHSMASSGMKRILVTGGNKVRYDDTASEEEDSGSFLRRLVLPSHC